MVVCYLLLILIGFTSAAEEFYSSIDQMKELLHTEKDLVTSLENYIQAEELKLEQIKSWAQKLANLSAFAIQDPEGFLGHPVNAFKLLKRLNKDWSELEILVLTNLSEAFISKLSIGRQNFPKEGEQTGAAEALLRLQDTYELDTNTLAKGELPGISQFRGSLTVDDCYDLGIMAYNKNDFYHTVLWLSQAFRQLEQGETPVTVGAVTILDYLSFSFYKQGDLQRASEFTKKLLEIDPVHDRAIKNQKYYEFHLEQQKTGQETTETPKTGRTKHNAVYERLCRGDSIELTPHRRSGLFCRYHDNHRHPNLVIGPVKEEDVWDQPHIVRYHDVASEEDMEMIREWAKPKLKRSKVNDYKNNQSRVSTVRVSQNAWMDDTYAVANRLSKRVGYVTGLEMTTAEQMQVVNYGVGGQYEPHVDFQGDDIPEPYPKLGTGNRIATWLFYISDVQAGGATVFPDVGAIVEPIKGSAVLWYNLYLNGKGDYRTRHAACPVLVGSKWVANKWMHERGQEFRRRCSLENS
ncbi:prolyl 4-hydroxylase subunit alpha-1-like [Corythoichthys intestinalis]|uniref:prolyl 4-hydroxylase subunit alpha-1-like n=1 Tax=Corythoichthys intestinalis TaxID=161448 RepID=UPI0025A63339|nr:prolyl 4-hydroxylase subunit alpha-1-like [Corythoichthys intestinalis]